jgi:hypothetical protein
MTPSSSFPNVSSSDAWSDPLPTNISAWQVQLAAVFKFKIDNMIGFAAINGYCMRMHSIPVAQE